jgi:hypothetical protein
MKQNEMIKWKFITNWNNMDIYFKQTLLTFSVSNSHHQYHQENITERSWHVHIYIYIYIAKSLFISFFFSGLFQHLIHICIYKYILICVANTFILVCFLSLSPSPFCFVAVVLNRYFPSSTITSFGHGNEVRQKMRN